MIRIVYAGLLGVAQNLMGIIQHVDFKSLGAELHIYGGGNQKTAIMKYVAEHEDSSVFFHGFVEADQVNGILRQYDAALIPLVTYIKGAVPSKIFDTMPLGLPIFFCGEGEGARIVRKYGLGFVSKCNDAQGLASNIEQFSRMDVLERERMSQRSLQASQKLFNYEAQMDKCYDFLKTI